MSDPGSQTVYESEVTQVGGQVEAFLGHGLLIFFQTDSPAELHDMSVLHTASIASDGPAPGDTIHLGDNAMKVLGVGSVVRDNLLNLGHLDLKADGPDHASHPFLEGHHHELSNTPTSTRK